VSFETISREVRDETNTILVRSRALRKCVSRFHPLGYYETLEYLKQAVNFDTDWTSEQLLLAIDMLEVPYVAYEKFVAGWVERRCALKRAGQRSPTSAERAELLTRAWLAWPENPKPKPVRAAPMFESFPFRESQRADYLALLAALPNAAFEGSSTFEVWVYGDLLAIPYRIYNPEASQEVIASLSPTQQMMLHCLFTRHHDGFVRQRHLFPILDDDKPWVVPYVVALIGEYVVEILHDIEKGIADIERLESKRRRLYGRFAADNAEFIELTKNRVARYWSQYHSSGYLNPTRNHLERTDPGIDVYPGFTLIALLLSASKGL
jgi:hypothetical protein